jgi:Domain of unknown function (DUF6532)
VTRTRPFSHPILSDIICAQFFGKGKADIETYNKMVAEGKIPEAVVILVVTAVRVMHTFGPWLTRANI